MEIGRKCKEQQHAGKNRTKIPLDLRFHWKSRGLLCFVEDRLAKKETALRLSSLVNSAGLEGELCKPSCPVDRSQKPLPLLCHGAEKFNIFTRLLHLIISFLAFYIIPNRRNISTLFLLSSLILFSLKMIFSVVFLPFPKLLNISL